MIAHHTVCDLWSLPETERDAIFDAMKALDAEAAGTGPPAVSSLDRFIPVGLSREGRAAALQHMILQHVELLSVRGVDSAAPSEYRQLAQGDRDQEEAIQAAFLHVLPTLDNLAIDPLSPPLKGGMGRVFRGYERNPERVVAVKVLKEELVADEAARRRFLREITLLGSVAHPHIIQVYRAGLLTSPNVGLDSAIACVMEFADAGSLEMHADRYRDPQAAAALVRDLALAVHEMYRRRRLLHLDLKPANILFQAAECGRLHPKIADFGLAAIHGSSRPAEGIRRAGSPGWSPAEVIGGLDDQIGPPSDVFGLGAILLYLLVGSTPYPSAESPQEHDGYPCATVAGSVPPDLKAIVHTCLRRNPSLRYPNALFLAQDLERFLVGESVSVRQRSRWERLRASRSARRALIVSVLAVIAAGTGMSLWRAGRSAVLSRIAQDAPALLTVPQVRPLGGALQPFQWGESVLHPGVDLRLAPSQVSVGEAQYLLAFDSTGHSKFFVPAEVEGWTSSSWPWTLTKPGLETVILVVSSNPIGAGRLAAMEAQIDAVIPDASLPQGVRLQWRDLRVWEEDARLEPRGEPSSKRESVQWAEKVAAILGAEPGVRFHGWTFRVMP